MTTRRPPSATEMVSSYLSRYGTPYLCDGRPFVARGEDPLTADFLTRWVWKDFAQVPRRAAVSDALAVLRSLATRQPQLVRTA